MFLLTDQEVVDALREGRRRSDGLLEIDLPASRLAEAGPRPLVLTFVAGSRVVSCGAASVRLSGLQFRLLEYVYTHQTAGTEELADAVWQRRKVSDGSIRAALSKINTRLLSAGFEAELSAHRGRVSLVKIG